MITATCRGFCSEAQTFRSAPTYQFSCPITHVLNGRHRDSSLFYRTAQVRAHFINSDGL